MPLQQSPSPIQRRTPPSNREAGSLRVLQLNVWGRSGDWDARRQVLRDGLSRLDPDLVCFVESVVDSEYSQSVDLLGSDYHFLEQQRRQDDGSGVSMASRWPILRSEEVDLHLVAPRNKEFPCVALLEQVDAPAELGSLTFVAYNPSWELDMEVEREAQAPFVAARISDFAPSNGHVILAGDLDADPSATSIRFWTGRTAIDGTSVCYRDAWESIHRNEPGETFTPRNPLVAAHAPDWPFRRIDYIFVRCSEHAGSSLEIVDCQLAFDVPVDGVWASDHFGLVADLRPRRER